MSVQAGPRAMRSRSSDLALCVVAAIGVVLLVTAIQLFWGQDALLRWGMFVAFSTLLLWRLAAASPRRHEAGFRRFFATFAFLHVFTWLAVLSRVSSWRLADFAPMVIEVPIFVWLYDRFFARG